MATTRRHRVTTRLGMSSSSAATMQPRPPAYCGSHSVSAGPYNCNYSRHSPRRSPRGTPRSARHLSTSRGRRREGVVGVWECVWITVDRTTDTTAIENYLIPMSLLIAPSDRTTDTTAVENYRILMSLLIAPSARSNRASIQKHRGTIRAAPAPQPAHGALYRLPRGNTGTRGRANRPPVQEKGRPPQTPSVKITVAPVKA